MNSACCFPTKKWAISVFTNGYITFLGTDKNAFLRCSGFVICRRLLSILRSFCPMSSVLHPLEIKSYLLAYLLLLILHCNKQVKTHMIYRGMLTLTEVHNNGPEAES